MTKPQDEFGMTIKIEKLIEDITDAGGMLGCLICILGYSCLRIELEDDAKCVLVYDCAVHVCVYIYIYRVFIYGMVRGKVNEYSPGLPFSLICILATIGTVSGKARHPHIPFQSRI